MAHGGLTIKVVGGDHLTMVAEPHVALLADYLAADIDANVTDIGPIGPTGAFGKLDAPMEHFGPPRASHPLTEPMVPQDGKADP